MKITFFGGAQSVTGSNYMVEHGDLKFLIDCGLFQGSPDAELRNYDPFPYDPSKIDYVFVTHSHADHTGRLPKLYKEGFRGVLYATHPLVDMIKIALPDNLSILKEEARKEMHPVLFSAADLEGIINLAQGKDYGEVLDLGSGVTATLHDAGHILGSAIIEINIEGKKIYFSGDLGNPPTPLLKNFEYPVDANYVVVESAYGARVHEDRKERREILQNVIKDTIKRNGTLMIPSFAMERTQELLFELNNLINAGEIPEVPIFVDSPLATHLTEVYRKYPDYFNKEAAYLIHSGDDIFNFPGLRFTLTTEESKGINDIKGAKVIIAGSGMSTGGRILHHERRYLSDSNSTLLFIGYQAEGTLGRRILDGAEEVSIFGEKVSVRCTVKAIGGYSAHADQPTIVKWLEEGNKNKTLKTVFVVQGEAESADTLAGVIKERLSVDAIVPTVGQSVEI
ncbi:MBL fold metallo-hydrolase [Candidatus Parcubacteria bacterium]|nr:MBL fold metallo-hydrolase [Candidatus Parcubacteria bacterium]